MNHDVSEPTGKVALKFYGASIACNIRVIMAMMLERFKEKDISYAQLVKSREWCAQELI